MSSRDGWLRVKFDDVVRQGKDKADPESSGLERYVAGEHMDTDELQITRWGTIGDGYLGPAFHRRFRSGQVLYGSRRTYLRKVALADFDGICANTTFVCETKDPAVLLPELLPFVMQTESFHAHSIAQSKGSVNPYINWPDLAWYEFDLPPIDEQREIATLLWSTRRARTSWRTAQGKLTAGRAALFDHLVASTATRPMRLGDLLELVQYGTSKRCTDDPTSGDVPVLRIPNVVSGRLDLSNLKWGSFTPSEHDNYRIRVGDVLVVRTNGNPEYVGRGVALNRDAPARAVFASYLIRLRVRGESLEPDFLAALLGAPTFRAALRGSIRSSAGNYNLNATSIKAQKVPVPALDAQHLILRRLDKLGTTADMVDRLSGHIDVAEKRLIQTLLAEA